MLSEECKLKSTLLRSFLSYPVSSIHVGSDISLRSGIKQSVINTYRLYTVGSRFTAGLRYRIFGCKSNRRKTSSI